MNDYRDYLCHHGVIGQKWGVRRYQNKDGTLTPAGKIHYRDNDYVIEKGFRLNSVISGKEIDETVEKMVEGNTPKTIYTYDPNNEHDKMVYEGPFAMQQYTQKGARYILANEYETVNELRSPGDKKRVDLFVESYKNNKQDYDEALTNFTNDLKTIIREDKNISKELKRELQQLAKYHPNMSDNELRNLGYKTMMTALPWKDIDESVKKVYDEYYDLVKSKGYNSIIDDNNRKVYNDAVMPLIVFDTDKNLSLIGNKPLTTEEIKELVTKAYQYNFRKTGKLKID